jgi:hypothetical protein
VVFGGSNQVIVLRQDMNNRGTFLFTGYLN